jgi:hypothetical protein
MTQPEEALPVTSAVVDQISAHVGDGLTTEQVQAVLTAWNAVRQGDPVGTVLFDPVTKAIAHRVEVEGVQMWRCSAPDGGQWNDMQPTLAWDVLYSVTT